MVFYPALLSTSFQFYHDYLHDYACMSKVSPVLGYSSDFVVYVRVCIGI